MSDEICRCSHPKEFHQSFLKEVPCDYDGKCVVGCQKFEPVGPDRHPKWQRVEPGTVIPAGQPYRVEWRQPEGKHGHDYPGGEAEFTTWLDWNHEDWFIDSSWKPPLVLPTEPTWGIAVVEDTEDSPIEWVVDRWTHEQRKYDSTRRMSGYHTAGLYEDDEVIDFIPLTDEQVARIEAAR